jgi:hypothetical protein
MRSHPDGDGSKDVMNTKTNTDTIGLLELTDQELAGVSGGVTVNQAVQNAVKYIQSITSGGGAVSGGQNDPAQMFAQILQQLT